MTGLNKTYLSLLTEAITKKENKLNNLIMETIKQNNCFRDNEFDEEKYDELYNRKLELIQEIAVLDDGFEALYQRVKDEIKDNKYAYETEIKDLQKRIRIITDMTIHLQKLENDNKIKFEAYIASHKRKIKEYTLSKKSAAAYYKNMMQQFSGDAAFYSKTK